MASIDFTELYTSLWSGSTISSTWMEAATGAPANSVVCILHLQLNETNPCVVGVREVGSSLERKVTIHESESGGYTSCIMHVQTDAAGWVELLGGRGEYRAYLLGYYGTGITYTEEMTLYDSTVADWRTQAVGQNNTVFEFRCENDTDGDGTIVGVRGVGSSLARY